MAQVHFRGKHHLFQKPVQSELFFPGGVLKDTYIYIYIEPAPCGLLASVSEVWFAQPCPTRNSVPRVWAQPCREANAKLRGEVVQDRAGPAEDLRHCTCCCPQVSFLVVLVEK